MADEQDRPTGQKVISVSLPEELLKQIDVRADSLGLPRSTYLVLLAKADLREMGALTVAAASKEKPVELTPEAREFLFAAIPELAALECQRENQPVPELSRPTSAVALATLWDQFLDERDQILKHKWIESQKAGFDIGIERAVRDWLEKHHPQWVNFRRQEKKKGSSRNSAERE
jgi:hypothetical protein